MLLRAPISFEHFSKAFFLSAQVVEQKLRPHFCYSRSFRNPRKLCLHLILPLIKTTRCLNGTIRRPGKKGREFAPWTTSKKTALGVAMDWKSFLRAYRKEKGLTQEALAERLGFSAQMVSRWERGRDQPSLSSELTPRRILAPRRSGVDGALWWSLKRSPALFILTDDRRRIMDTSSGHRDLYKYPDGTNYGVEIDRLSNDELVAAIERAGGAKALYGQSEGFALLSRRDPDRHSNMADCTRWVRYANAPILLDDGRRFWLATGVLEPEGAAQQLVIVN